MRTIRLISFRGFIVMLGFLFNSASANTHEYPQLYENRSTSDNYEITKLIDGPIDSLYKNRKTGEYIAQANSSLWKIDAKGQVIDYSRSNNFYASGLILEDEGFSDWVFTGDKQIKPYGKTLDAKDYSDQKLFAAFDQADAIEFVDKDETGFAYIYQNETVSILDISNRRDQIDDFYFRQSVSKDYNLRRDETDVNASRFKNYERKNVQFEVLSSSRKDALKNLNSTDFKKVATHRPISITETFFENLLGRIFSVGSRRDYGYPVGYTHYQLSHHNEQLQFSVFSDKEYDSAEAWNFKLINDQAKSADDLLFMAVNYRRHYLAELNEQSLLPYYEKDVGLYVVRKKIPHNHSNAPQWQLSYSGLHSYDSISGHIQFPHPKLEPVFYWFRQDRPLPAAARADLDHFGRKTNIASPILKSLPDSLDFQWMDFKRENNFRLVVNNQDAEFHKSEDTKVAIRLYFDPNELRQAFAQFSDTKETLELNLDLQEISFGGELIVSLNNQKKNIVLQNTSFDYQEIPYAPQSPRAISDKISNDLFLAYQDSLLELNPDFFLKKINILKDLNAISDQASSISYYFSQLSLTLNINSKFSDNTHLFTQYFKIHNDIIRNKPDALQHKNLMVLASQGIYLGANSHNPELSKKEISQFVDGILVLEQETDRAFLFNVACYYAINHEKAKMLKVINRTMELGRDPNSYLKDTDFKDYWQDPDFLKAIGKF
ncbi:MAG: hypothetical protein IPK77_09330 [Cellvibrio sp.]|nr:hypothetical protein [Cellvibrio sp.]